jgi:hypothetical protein
MTDPCPACENETWQQLLDEKWAVISNSLPPLPAMPAAGFGFNHMIAYANQVMGMTTAEAIDATRYRHLRDHYLRSCAHPLGDAIGMDEVIFGDDADSAIDADIKRRAGDAE